MQAHEFGSSGWTADKLERVRKYLCAYTSIFAKNPRARFFKTIYVDAFAGSGHWQSSKNSVSKRQAFDEDTQSLKKGSARIALEVEPPFDQYIFVEQNAKRVKELERLRDDYTERAERIQIERAEANEFMVRWCRETDWGGNRAVVFLDPYGMQVNWETIKAIAATKAIDLWLLFPLGVAVNRLLTSHKPPPKPWADALTRTFGTEDWKALFYPKKIETTLFGDEESQRRMATLEGVGEFFLTRLKDIFSRVAPRPLQLLNSRSIPIFILCFAAGNPKGAPTAVKIANDILK